MGDKEEHNIRSDSSMTREEENSVYHKALKCTFRSMNICHGNNVSCLSAMRNIVAEVILSFTVQRHNNHPVCMYVALKCR